MIDEMNIAGQNRLVCQETSCYKHATEGSGAFGSEGKHAGDCQASPGAGVDELGHPGTVLVIHNCKHTQYAHI